MRRTRSYSFHILRGHPLYRLFLEAQETLRDTVKKYIKQENVRAWVLTQS